MMEYLMIYATLTILWDVSTAEPPVVPCKSEADCDKGSDLVLHDFCSICSSKNTRTAEPKCAFPFDIALSVDSDRTCSYTKHCDNKPCNSNGTDSFSDGLGVCKCLCKTLFTGNSCEREVKDQKPDDPSNVSGCQLISPFIVRENEYVSILMVCERASISFRSDATSIQLLANNGMICNLASRGTDMKGIDVLRVCKTMFETGHPHVVLLCDKFLKAEARMWDMRIIFPHLPYVEGDDVVWQLDNRLQGYISDIRVNYWYSYDSTSVKKKRDLAYAGTLQRKLFVSYQRPEMNCAVTVELINCIQNFQQKATITNNKHLELDSSVSFVSDGLSAVEDSSEAMMDKCSDIIENPTYSWEIYYIRYGLQEDDADPVQTHYGSYWNIQPFTLEFGIHLIRLNVSGPGYYNFNQCWVYVTLRELTAKIDGGSSRKVPSENGVTLNVKRPEKRETEGKLKYTWSCNNTDEEICKPFTTTSEDYTPFEVGPDILKVGTSYNFTLVVESLDPSEARAKPAVAHQIIVVESLKKFVSSLGNCKMRSFEIVCVYNNCDADRTNSQDILYLRVNGSRSELEDCEFVWSWDMIGEEGSSVTTQVRQEDTPSHIFIAISHSLQPDHEYTFTARIGDITFGHTLKTAKETKTTCDELKPKSGRAGLDRFKLKCQSEYTEETTYSFEFYDRNSEDEEGYSGKLLGVSDTGVMDMVLYGDKVVVRKLDQFGFYVDTEIPLQLDKTPLEVYLIDQKFAELKRMANRGEVRNSFRQAALIAEVLTPSMDRNHIYSELIFILSKLELQRIGVLVQNGKMLASSLHRLLDSYQKKSVRLDLLASEQAAKIVASVANVLLVATTDGLDAHFSFKIMYQVVRYLLDCVDIILENKFEDYGPISEEKSKPIEYIRVMHGSKHLMMALKNIAKLLLLRHLPAQWQGEIQSHRGNTSIWVKVDFPERLSRFTLNSTNQETVPVIISEDTPNYAYNKDWYLGLEYTSFKTEPIWWLDVKKTISKGVYFCNKTEIYLSLYPKLLLKPIKIAFNSAELVSEVEPFTGVVTQLDPNLDEDELDKNLHIIRVDTPPRSKLIVKFDFTNNEGELKVLVRALRPELSDVKSEGSTISKDAAEYKVAYEPSDESQLYFIALLPTDNVPVGQTANYSATIYYQQCKAWMRGEWQTFGCYIGADEVEDRFVCECTHLSLFAGFVDSPNPRLDPFFDVELLLDDRNNFYPLLFILLLLLLFALLLLLACLLDRRGSAKRNVIVLSDNFPREQYGYLLCVVTGSRIMAGTASEVGVRMWGDFAESRPHILTSDKRRVLQALNEDWFLIFTEAHLGPIQCITVWHNDMGVFPTWFLNKIVIYDMTDKQFYHFYMYDWLSLRLDAYPEVMLMPAPISEVLAVRRVYLETLDSGFRCCHLWIASLVRHPRDPVSRVDRFMIILCFILIVMATSLLILNFSTGAHFMIDDPYYSITPGDLMVALISCVVASLVACLLINLFKKIYRVTYFVERDEAKEMELVKKMCRRTFSRSREKLGSMHVEDVKESKESTKVLEEFYDPDFYIKSRYEYDESSETIQLKYGRTMPNKQHLMIPMKKGVLQKALLPRALVPVQMEEDKSNVSLKIPLLIITWVVCIVIVVVCVMVVLSLSFRLATVRTFEWMTIVLLAVLFHAVLLLPIKIILVAAIVAIFFKRHIYTDIYTFSLMKAVQEVINRGDEGYLFHLFKLRTQPIYVPMYEQLREIKRQKKKRIHNWYSVVHFLVMLGFLLVLGFVIMDESSRFYVNDNARTMINTSHQSPPNHFLSINDKKDFELYLTSTFVKNSYHFVWYNLRPLTTGDEKYYRKDWMYDVTRRMLGKIHIRQLRVKRDYCSLPKVFNMTRSMCAPGWGRVWSEDTRDYMRYWIPADGSLEGLDLQYWTYLDSSENRDFNFYGRMGYSYHAGGYVLDMGDTQTETEEAAEGLVEDFWLDHYTRAVLIHLVIYNANTNLITQVTLVIEHTVAGQYLPTIMVTTVDIYVHVDVWAVIFLIFLTVFVLRVLLLMNAYGVLGYFRYFPHVFELLLVLLGFLSVIMFVLHNYLATSYLSHFNLNFQDRFKFYNIAFYFYNGIVILCFLFFLSILRFVSVWRFGRIYYTFFFTFVLSWETVLVVSAVFLLFSYMMWRGIAYLVSGFVASFFNPNLICRFGYNKITNFNKPFRHNFLVFILNFGVIVVMIAFFVVFVFVYVKARHFYVRDWHKLNILSFVWLELKSKRKRADKISQIGIKEVKERFLK